MSVGKGKENGIVVHPHDRKADEPSPDSRMDRLERRAGVVRSRLLRAIDALDTRRHQVVELGETAKKLALPTAIGLASVTALLGLGVAAFALAFRARHRRSLSHRATRSIAKTIRELELVPRPSLTRRLFEKAALSAVSMATAEILRRALKNGLDGRLLDGRIAVGKALEAHHEELSAHALFEAKPTAPTSLTGIGKP